LLMHYFDPNVAAEYGIAEAVIINHLQFWINYNKRSGRNEIDGRFWTYHTSKSMAESFPYLSEKQIWLALDRLVKAGVVMKANYNKTGYDRTIWYAFVLESFWICPEGKFHFPYRENLPSTDGEPIPDNSTDNKPDNLFPIDDAIGDQKPKPQQKKSVVKKKVSHDKDWQRWVDRWDQFFRKRHNDTPPMFNGAQLGPSGLKGIRKHLIAISTKFEDKSEDDCGFLAWDYILNHWDQMGDNFLQSQFDLTVILKKINDILNRLKNGTTKTTRTNQQNSASSSLGKKSGGFVHFANAVNAIKQAGGGNN
jgi:hypothetical protein